MKKLLLLTIASYALLLTGSAAAVEFDEVRDFEDVFVISGQSSSREWLEVTWKIEPDYYLYNNRFLKFTVATSGVTMGEPQIPRGEIKFDDLLGEEVEKYHSSLTVRLPIDYVAENVHAIQLKVRSQGCLEGVLCYPPTEQLLLVSLPLAQALPAYSVIEDEPQAGGVSASLQSPGLVDDLLGMGRTPALEPVDAFQYEAIGLDEETILVRFTSQAGYYLYRDKFEFRVIGNEAFGVQSVELPDGVIKDDPEFGDVPVYYGQVEIPVKLRRPAGPQLDLTLEADFQGCRDGDICYPPQSRLVTFAMPAASEAIGSVPGAEIGSATAVIRPPSKPLPPLSEQDRLASLLTDSPTSAMLAFFIAGILLAFTPCVFPMVPILSGIIAGQGDQITTARAFSLSLIYVLAMAVTYTIAGVLAGLFGENLQATFQNPWIISSFVLIFILLALSMFGFYELQLPASLQSRLADMSNRQQSGNLVGVAIMGFLSALIVGPCVAPPLMAALIVIGASGDAVLGGTALFAMSMGMGLPLIAFGVSAGKLLPRAGQWMNTVKAVFGMGLLALSIWMLERILSGGLIMALWGCLAIASAVYMGAFDRIESGASGWKRLWKSIGLVLLVVGVLELVGAAAGGDNWLRPLESQRLGGDATQSVSHISFQRVKSLQELDEALLVANASGKGGMLDFYADWCVECIRMERNTFPEPRVQALLERLQPLQADVTANDDIDQALMRHFGIIGPPAILFFDRNGNEMKRYRLVGYFAPEEFTEHLDLVLAAQ